MRPVCRFAECLVTIHHTDKHLARLKDINENCLEVFRAHWNCLDNNNHQMWQCRRPERVLNRCVFEKIVRSHRQCSWRMSFGILTVPSGSREGNSRYAARSHPSAFEGEADLCRQEDCGLPVGSRRGNLQERGRSSKDSSVMSRGRGSRTIVYTESNGSSSNHYPATSSD